MSDAVQRYEQWISDPGMDEDTLRELTSIAGQEQEIEDRFYKELEFGTGGLRGVIGAGTNRMNRYTIGKTTEGLARFLEHKPAAQGHVPSAVIAHDSRHRSPEFALEAALVLAAHGIKAYVFESLRPTPVLSFAVRHLQADAGIVITASHNPPEYNGYKVYGADGGQMVPDAAEQVMREIAGVAALSEIKTLSREAAEAKGSLVWIGEQVDAAYVQAVLAASPNRDALTEAAGALKIVYTPLHGAGNVPVRRVLQMRGFRQVQVVPEQELPDPDFSTVASPNPEEPQAFELAREQALKSDADLIIGTDPDCDRMGALVKAGPGDYRILTGNQAGAIMLEYLLASLQAQGRLPGNGTVIKTIVTSELGAAVAKSYGVEVMNTLTGFKYIGEKMTRFERDGSRTFLFGYEESYGYLAGNYCRDKDAVLACMLISEAAAYYKSQNLNLIDVLHRLYDKFGFYREALKSITLKGVDGVRAIRGIMEEWRERPPEQAGGRNIAQKLDYAEGLNGLPKENALKFILEDGSWFCMRPSGTEPKIKIYFAVREKNQSAAAANLEALQQDVLKRIEQP